MAERWTCRWRILLRMGKKLDKHCSHSPPPAGGRGRRCRTFFFLPPWLCTSLVSKRQLFSRAWSGLSSFVAALLFYPRELELACIDQVPFLTTLHRQVQVPSGILPHNHGAPLGCTQCRLQAAQQCSPRCYKSTVVLRWPQSPGCGRMPSCRPCQRGAAEEKARRERKNKGSLPLFRGGGRQRRTLRCDGTSPRKEKQFLEAVQHGKAGRRGSRKQLPA